MVLYGVKYNTVRRYHPDKNQGRGVEEDERREAMLRLVIDAKETLIDAEFRSHHERSLLTLAEIQRNRREESRPESLSNAEICRRLSEALVNGSLRPLELALEAVCEAGMTESEDYRVADQACDAARFRV